MDFFRDHPQLLLVGGLLLITMFFMSRMVKRRKRGPASIVGPHEQLERLKQARGMRGDLEQLMVEIEQMAKRMGAHLDAKSMRIERLLDEADERIAKLEALEQHRTGDGSASSTASSSTPNNAAGQADASSTNDDSSASQLLVTATTPSEPAVDSLPDDPLARSVYKLADEGVDPHQIARQLDEHVGKVELILALRSA